MQFDIKFVENPSDEDIQILANGIDSFSKSIIPRGDKISLTFFLINENGQIDGGVYGNYSSYNWLYIQALWVSETVRTGGYGRLLMNAIEQKAVESSCTAAYLDTFSFQAPNFYKKLGYKVFGELKDFPTGHSRIFLSKQLISTELK